MQKSRVQRQVTDLKAYYFAANILGKAAIQAFFAQIFIKIIE
ncbi:hypothetical protein ACO0LF_25720 [Undibacterium sp. Di27W]